jgi:hypothetical protein
MLRRLYYILCNVEPSDRLLERITYTASLATRYEDISPMLEVMRGITARRSPGEPLASEDHSRLLEVQKQLEDYLVSREPLRLFTLDSLHLQIDQHLRGDTSHKSALQVGAVIVISFVAAGIATSLPRVSTPQQHGLVFGATTFSVITVGAAWLFLTALPAFKSELRRAFVVICAGVSLLGLSLLGQPIMEVYNLRHYPLTSILYSLPILCAAILFHTGDALYVRLVGVKNFWTSAKPLMFGWISLSLITLAIPHLSTKEPPVIHHFVAIIWAGMLLAPIVSAIILRMARRRLPEIYRPPITCLYQAMFPIIAVVLYQYIVRVVVGPYMQGMVAYILFALVTFMALGLLRAGYSFNKVSRY